MTGISEDELLIGYALPPSVPARDELLSTLQEAVERHAAIAADPSQVPMVATHHAGWRDGIQWALDAIRWRLPNIIEDSEWEAKKAQMDVAQYADSVR